MVCHYLVCFSPSPCFNVVFGYLANWSLRSKRKDSEPGTKSLLSNAEMMAHHPTDPVEMRRINFQTPGKQRLKGPPQPAVCAAGTRRAFGLMLRNSKAFEMIRVKAKRG